MKVTAYYEIMEELEIPDEMKDKSRRELIDCVVNQLIETHTESIGEILGIYDEDDEPLYEYQIKAGSNPSFLLRPGHRFFHKNY